MQAIARFYLFVHGMLALVVALRSLVDERSVAAWREADAIWGPDALPFNAAGGLAVGFACLYAVLSPSAFGAGVRWRVAAFLVLGFVVRASTGMGSGFVDLLLVLFFYAACREAEEARGRKPLSSGALREV